jgi:Xaa-Pro dipeptidase
MRPGKAVSGFYEEVIAEIKKSGLEPIPDYGLGQGIGLGLHEEPYINGTDQTPMKQGMCFALRLAVKNGKNGAVMTGDTILLTDDGPEKLTA